MKVIRQEPKPISLLGAIIKVLKDEERLICFDKATATFYAVCAKTFNTMVQPGTYKTTEALILHEYDNTCEIVRYLVQSEKTELLPKAGDIVINKTTTDVFIIIKLNDKFSLVDIETGERFYDTFKSTEELMLTYTALEYKPEATLTI